MNFREMNNKMIFRRDNDYGAFYSIGMNKKTADGNYENGYINVKFRNGVELDNMTKINIVESWLTFYNKTDSEGHTITQPYIFISAFELAEEEEQQATTEEPVEVDINDLPF